MQVCQMRPVWMRTTKNMKTKKSRKMVTTTSKFPASLCRRLVLMYTDIFRYTEEEAYVFRRIMKLQRGFPAVVKACSIDARAFVGLIGLVSNYMRLVSVIQLPCYRFPRLLVKHEEMIRHRWRPPSSISFTKTPRLDQSFSRFTTSTASWAPTQRIFGDSFILTRLIFSVLYPWRKSSTRIPCKIYALIFHLNWLITPGPLQPWSSTGRSSSLTMISLPLCMKVVLNMIQRTKWQGYFEDLSSFV